MAAFFLDSSAAVKLYVVEPGTAWVTNLTHPGSGHEFYAVSITEVEIAAALFRRVRSGTLDAAAAVAAFSTTRRDFASAFVVIEVTLPLINRAVTVAQRHALRGYDCVQLAGLLVAQEVRSTAGASPLTLISADVELNAAAIAEGFTVEDPNSYP